MRQRWSRQLLGVLGVRLEHRGPPLVPGALLVANHISWLDIFVVNALGPVAFVSKAEVRTWPLIGWLSACNDTVFLRRGSRGHARLVNQEIADRLEDGQNVALFPEGTTTDGSHILHFHGALLQPAISSGRPIQPLTLAYRNTDGSYTRAAAYDGDVTLGACIASIIRTPMIVAHLVMADTIESSQSDRKTLTAQAHEMIRRTLESL